jgi:hypothetical protein
MPKNFYFAHSFWSLLPLLGWAKIGRCCYLDSCMGGLELTKTNPRHEIMGHFDELFGFACPTFLISLIILEFR